MTSKTRTFIELSDLVALSFECRVCGATMSFDVRKDFNVQRAVECRNCGELWVRNIEGGSIEPTITKFVSALKELKNVLEGWQGKQRDRGFRLFLELNPITVRTIDPARG
jgi:transcription elongation factor Elf1